jgi:hypothetical protein
MTYYLSCLSLGLESVSFLLPDLYYTHCCFFVPSVLYHYLLPSALPSAEQ